MARALTGFAASPAGAATTAAGPYYANPSWDQTLPSSTRFIVLSNMNSAAVLDRETGLVWEQSPSTSTFTWDGAQFHCINLNAGGRTGWRLPTIQELQSLVDQSVPSPGPKLPSGHPFNNVQSSGYWSATTYAASTGSTSWVVAFNVDVVDPYGKSVPPLCLVRARRTGGGSSVISGRNHGERRAGRL